MLDQPTSPSDVDDDLGQPDRISPRSLTLSVGHAGHRAAARRARGAARALRDQQPRAHARRAGRARRHPADPDLRRRDVRLDRRAAADHGVGHGRTRVPVERRRASCRAGCRRWVGGPAGRAALPAGPDAGRDRRVEHRRDGLLAGERRRRRAHRAGLRGPRDARRRRHGRGVRRGGQGRGGGRHRRPRRHRGARLPGAASGCWTTVEAGRHRDAHGPSARPGGRHPDRDRPRRTTAARRSACSSTRRSTCRWT